MCGTGKGIEPRTKFHIKTQNMNLLVNKPQLGESNFDVQEIEKRWGVLPKSMVVIEYCGQGDRAFGGSADDRPLLKSGMIAGGHPRTNKDIAQFDTLSQAHEAAKKISNRRENTLLGVAPSW